MDSWADLNLIRVFGIYLWVVFAVSLVRRFALYKGIAEMVFAVPQRWPRLFQILKEKRIVFLSWATFRPAVLALIVTVAYMICARWVWPAATVTPTDLVSHWWMLPVVLLWGVPMLAVDFYTLIRVSGWNRDEITKHLDEAEYWLKSWKAPVVRFFTLGFVDPRKMVREEVHKAMMLGRDLLNRTLWWVVLQAGLRVGFGLTLWGIWVYFLVR